jgi:hypothetical protein
VKAALSILTFIFICAGVLGQADSLNLKDTVSGRYYLIQNVERNGVTMPEIEIKDVRVVARPGLESRKSDLRKYDRLIYNIKKVYPYALVVRRKLDEVNSRLGSLESDKKRREYIKEFEKNIFGEYEDDIRQMTISQGRLLIKLIDRETQNTSYNLIRDYRGKFSAAFWQGIAKIFGTNLKEEYDPYGEDALIEIIIYQIEAGEL